MDPQYSISARGIGKQYVLGGAEQVYESFGAMLRGAALAPFRKFKKLSGQDTSNLFWALRDIDFDVPIGQVTGVIGRNGAGKSTLLKILSRITSPTQGEVALRGRVASLLEVGSGFHPELTGRENIYMNASILGMSRLEVNRKLDDIVEFAEVEKFLDTPVKRYSSGMYVRLAFSVAAHVDPDILLVDEVLAVGDSKFQQRCIGKLSEVGQQGRTVVFVSHNVGLIQELCSHSIYLSEGRIKQYDLTANVVPQYLRAGSECKGQWLASEPDASIRKVRLLNEQGAVTESVGYLDPLRLVMEFDARRKDDDYTLSVCVTNEIGKDLFMSWDKDSLQRKTSIGKKYNATCELPVGLLRPGRYFVTAACRYMSHGYLDYIEEAAVEFEITNKDFPMHENRFGVVLPVLDWQCEQQ